MEQDYMSTIDLLDLVKNHALELSLLDSSGDFSTGLSLGLEKSGRYSFRSFDGQIYLVTASDFFHSFPYISDKVWRIDGKKKTSHYLHNMKVRVLSLCFQWYIFYL